MTSTSQINALIIEDSKETQQYLTSLISSNFPRIEIKGYAETIANAIHLINSSDPELVFMDIELNDGEAFEIFNEIRSIDFEVIFITGTTNNTEKAFEHFALSYITKPINEKLLFNTIQHYLKLKQRLFNIEKLELFHSFMSKGRKSIFVQTSHEHILVNFEDLIKIEASGNYCYIHLKDGRNLLASKGVKHFEELLPKTSFFRASRSTLINITFIKSIFKKETIILINGDKIHVSTRNKVHLNTILNS